MDFEHMSSSGQMGTLYAKKWTLVFYLGHNLGTFYATKLKFGMLLTRT